MRILVVGTDREVASPISGAAKRQMAYFEGHEADIIGLATGEPKHVPLTSSIRAHVPGGMNKIHAFFRTLILLRRLGREQAYDIVSSQDAVFSGLIAWMFARKNSVPLVIQLHGNYLDNPLWMHASLKNRLMNAVGKWLVRRADGVRCVSARLCREMEERFHIPAARMMSLPICTDLSVFSPQGDRHDGGPFVLFVGRLIDEKSPFLFCDVMIPLLQAQPELSVVLIGEGDRRAALEKRFADAGVGSRVRFTGQLAAPDVAKWYRSAVCLLHTAAWEGWGMPMIESMACGCPVVTTDTGCAGEAVRDGENGIVTKVDDVDAMREGVRRCLEQPELVARYRQASIREAERWSFSARVKDQVTFYEHIARTAHSGDRSRRTGGHPGA